MKLGFFIPRADVAPGGEAAIVSGGTMYDLTMAEKLTAFGHRVNVIDTPMTIATRELDVWVRLWERFNFDAVVQDELGFEAYGKLNHRLDRVGNAVARVGLTHVPTARLHRQLGTQRAEYTFITSVHLNLFVSHAIHKETERLLGPVSAGVVVPPGVDHLPLPRERSAAVERPFCFVNVGHFMPHKGQLELLAVLAQLPKGGWKARLIGRQNVDAQYGRAVRERCAALGLGEQVELPGELSGAALSEALASADVFMASASYESFGIAIAEAVRAGLPVVGWTEGGPWDYLAHQRDALKIWPGNTAGFASALQTLMTDSAEFEKLRTGARQTGEALPTWEEAARALEASLLHLLEERAAAKAGTC
jgi:glycosyltransferase involved in cell wall biosynthesis